MTMRKLSFIFFLILLVTKVGFADQSKVDSLWKEYRNAEHDTTKVKILVELTELIYLHNPDTVIPLCQKAIEIIDKNLPHANPQEEISFLHTKASALNNIGFIYDDLGEIDKALKYYFKSLEIFEEFFLEEMQKKWSKNLDGRTFLNIEKIFKKGLAVAYSNIGLIYDDQGEIDKAIEYFFLSLKIKEEIKDKKGMAGSYNNIGVIYRNQGEIDKGLEYIFLSLKIKEEIKDKRGMAVSYNNIGLIYIDQGEIGKGLEYFFLSLKILEEIKDKEGMAYSYHNIGGVLCNLDSLEVGMRYLELGLKLNEELGNKAGVSSTTSLIGGWQLKLDQVEDALESGLEALAAAKEIGHVERMEIASELLSDVYKQQGQFEDALSMYELQIQMRDSIKNKENTKTLVRQQMKYDYEKTEIIKENEEKEKARIETEATSRRNTIHYTAIFIGLLLVFGLVLALGFVKVNPKTAQAIIFISFLIVFEFLLVVADPYIEDWSGGAPGWKLLFNAVLAGLIFPLHQFFERKLKKRLIKVERKKRGIGVKPWMIGLLVVSHSVGFGQSESQKSKDIKVISHNSVTDSLKTAYQTAVDDIEKINALFGWAEFIYLSKPDSSLILNHLNEKLIRKSLEKTSPSNKKKTIQLNMDLAVVLRNLSYFHSENGNIQAALDMNVESLRINKTLLDENLDDPTFVKNENLCKKGLATAYNNIGLIYGDQGEIEKALKHYFLSLKIYEEIKDKKGIAYSYNNIGFVYHNQGENEKALEYFLLSLKVKDQIKDKGGLATAYNNIGLTYLNQGKIDKALEYFLSSLKIREEIKDKYGMANSYHNIGSILCKRDRLDEGLRYLALGQRIFKGLGYKADMSASYSSIGGWQLKLGEVEDALKSGLEALAVAKEIGNVDCMERGARLLTDVHKRQGNYEDALTMYELEIQMRDSINNEENTKATIRQQMKYEYEKEQILAEQARKDQLRIINEQLSRRDNLHYSAIFIGILILFGGVLMLGFVKVRPKDVEGIIFISFLILFEFVLVLADPHIEQYTAGAPGYKLLFNAGIAGLMFPLHQFFEGKLKKRIIKVQRKKLRKRMEQYKKDTEGM